jgi:hypothetical protein
MTDAADLDAGTVVVDREADRRDRDEAVVVNTPPVAAVAWEIGDETVAEYPGNEAYPADDPVAVVVYREAFDRRGRDPDSVDDQLPLADLELPHYAFPASRLRVVERRREDEEDHDADANEDAPADEGETPGDAEGGPGPGPRHGRDTLADAPEDLAAIAAAVRERNVDDVTVDRDEEVVRVEKLGFTLTVMRDGSVTDSGAFADALSDVAQAALEELDDETDEEGVVA